MPREDDQPDYMPLYEEAGQKHHVDPDLLAAVGDVESHQDRYAESPAGAGGLMQLMPGTAEELNVTDRFAPRQSVFGGTRYLRRQLDSFNNVNDALSAYNAGPHGNWDNEETQNYVEAVNARWHARRMARLQRQQQPPAAPEAPPPSGGLFDDVLHKQSPAAQTGGLFDDVLPQQKGPPAKQDEGPPAKQDEGVTAQAPEQPPAPDVGMTGSLLHGVTAPVHEFGQTLQTALTGRPGEEAPRVAAAEPMDLKKDSLWTLAEKAAHGIAASWPEMAAFGGASLLGGGPESPLGIAIGSLGAGAVHATRTFGPVFGEELRRTPNDPDTAFDRTWVRTGIDSVATSLGFGAFGAVNPFRSTLKNLAFQAFGVQPGIAAGEQVAQNTAAGQPATQGVAEGYVPSVIGAAVPIAGFEGAKLAGRGVQAVTDAMRPVPAPLQAGLDAQRQGAAGAQGQPGAPPPQQGPPPPPMGPPPPPQGPPEAPHGPPPPPQGPPEAPHGPPPPPQGPPPPPQGPPPPPAAPPPTDPQSVLVDIARGGDGTGKPPTNPPAANPPLTPPPSPAAETANPPISPLTRPPEGEPATRPIAPPEATPPPPTSGSYVMLRPDQLNVDPARFQYKAADESGVTGVLRGAKKWESDLADPILAWQDNAGKMWVVNGHQRMDLARRAEAAGQTDIQIPARIMREADGYTPEYMRALGAYVNIAQGSGTAIDAAKVLRAIGTLPPSLRDRLPQLSSTGAIMRDAKGLVGLNPDAFGAVVNGVIDPSHAAHVGNLIPNDPVMQNAAIQVLAKARPANAEQARIMVEDVRNQEIERQHQGAQGTLTGFEPQAQSLVPQRAQVLDHVLRLLRQAKSRYSGAIKGEGTLTSVEGNKINVEGTQTAKSQNEELIAKLEANALVRGAVSDALTAAARDLAAGQPIAQVGARFLAAARAIDPGAGAEGLQRGADHGGADQARSGEGKGPEDEGPEPPVEGQEGFFQRKVPLPLPSGEDLFGAQRQAPQRREADPLFHTDQRQQAMPGMEPTAQQAQASRDQAGRGALLPKKDQQALDFGLFGKPQAEQGDLLAPRSATNLAPKTSRWQEPRFTDEMHTVHWPPDVNGHAVGRDWTMERGKQTGNEHILVTALDGTVLHAGTGNEKSFAPFDAGEHLKGMAPDSVVIHHNHPSGGALSDQDVYMLIFPQISHVVAHGSDGRGLTYSATLGPQGRQWRDTEPWDVVHSRLKLAFKRAEDTALRVLSTVFQQGRITEADFRKFYWDVVHRVVSLDSTTHYLSRNELPAPVMLALMRHTHDVLGIRYDPSTNRYANATDADRRIAGLDRARGGQPVQGPSATAGSGAENPGVDRQSGQGPRPVQGRLLEGFAERKEKGEPDAQRARDTLNAASRGVMRWLGVPETVGLKFVDNLLAGGADGSYQHNLITYALDTASPEAPIKFWHEAVHALRDEKLGLLTPMQNKALDVAAHKWLNDRNEGQQRQFEMRSQGITDPKTMREEAIARLAEDALRQGERGRTLMGAVAHLWRNFGRGIGQMLRGQGYHTADDVFAALMRGDRATPSAAGDMVSAALGRTTAPGDGQSQPRAAAGEETPTVSRAAKDAKPEDYVVNGTQITLPGTYFSRRTPQWLQNRAQTSPIARAAVAIDDARERISDSVMHAISPMTQGSKRAMDFAFRFANAQRAIQQEYGRIDRNITTNFDPAARARMGTAMDNESVFEQQLAQALHPPAPPAQGVLGQPPPPPPPPPPTPAMVAQMRAAFDAGGTGIAGLAPNERAVVQQLAQLAAGTWQRMQSRGMVAPGAEGLPFYFARQIILRGPGDEISSASGAGGGRDINEIGKNLTTQGAMARKHLTPQETEQAAKAALGQNAELLTDVRSLIQRLASQERGVAGTDLINAIERVGQLTGVNTVVRGTIPGALNPADYFTLNHPSFRQWAGGGWQDIRVAREFEGPLKAVLSTKTGDAYNALMKVKGFSMHAIMYSPLMHLSVEFGRAFPLMPLKMLALLPFTRGHRLMQDEAYMRNAVQHGLAPIGQGWSLDPVRIAEEARTGQGFLAQLQQNPLGRAAATAWDWWSRRVLWDNVFRLQVGIYDEMLSRFQQKGFAPDVSATMAGHIANRYAGALPPENLSKLTNQIANLTLFSRSFTLGNLGVIKDMMNGAPQHIRATIEQMASPQVADQAQAVLKRKAQAAFILDIGIMLAANSGAQLLAQTLIRGWSMGLPQAAQDVYDEWVKETKQSFSKIGQNPLNAFGFLPEYHNEPGKQQRVYVGNDSAGRGVYFRLAVGKIGEEFLGWFSHPGDMVLNKLSPQLRPFLELAIGEDTLHRPILKPDPKTIGDYLSNAGRTVTHLFQAQLPIGAIGGLHDVVTGAKGGDPFIAAAKVAVPFTGLGQLSSGYPGGPEAGKIAGYKRSTQFDIKQAYPAATRAAQSGAPDAIATAARILRDAGEEDLKQAFRTAKFLANPSVAVARSRGRYLRTHPGAREAMEE